MENFIDEIKRTARKRIFYTGHAIEEMNLEKEVITPDEVREVLFDGDIIEDFPDDKRGHSCLMFAYTSQGRPLHVVCSPKEEYLGIITVYSPDLDILLPGFRIRRKRT